jgi:hypothetical protein
LSATPPSLPSPMAAIRASRSSSLNTLLTTGSSTSFLVSSDLDEHQTRVIIHAPAPHSVLSSKLTTAEHNPKKKRRCVHECGCAEPVDRRHTIGHAQHKPTTRGRCAFERNLCANCLR